MSLKKQALSGMIWTFTDTVILKGLSFLASIVLARFLGPSEFGLIGLITIFIAIGNTLIDGGMTSSLVRTDNPDSNDFSTVFYLNLLTSVIVYVLIFLSAPLISSFYNQSVLSPIIRVYCLSFIISAFTSVQITVLIKNLQFRLLTYYNIPSTIGGIIVGLIMGYLGYGVWSIVWMYLSTQIIRSLLLWSLSNWKPNAEFSKSKSIVHFKFGYKLMLSGLINTIFNNIYNVVIGKFYSLSTIGYYERARYFNDYPVMSITGIIEKVTYPVLSNIKHDTERLSSVYKKIFCATLFAVVPLMLLSAAIARPLFELFLGKEWLPAVPFFQILCLTGVLYPIHVFNLNVLKVLGRSDLFLRLELIKKGFVTIGVIIGFQFGIYGLLWSSVFTSFISLIINTHYSGNMIKYNTKEQLLDFAPILFYGGVMFAAVYFSQEFIQEFSLIQQVSMLLLSGIIIYFALSLVFKSAALELIIKNIKTYQL